MTVVVWGLVGVECLIRLAASREKRLSIPILTFFETKKLNEDTVQSQPRSL